MSEQNLIERSWAFYDGMMRRQGTSTDEISFVGGFMACFGMLSGRVPIGLPPGYTVLQAFEQIQKELDAMRMKAIQVQAEDFRDGY